MVASRVTVACMMAATALTLHGCGGSSDSPTTTPTPNAGHGGISCDSPTCVKLNNGIDMPVVAFAAQVWSSAVCKSATKDAMTAGFRFIWSSILVTADCQRAQGEAISESSIPRSDLFIAGTVNTGRCSGSDSCYDSTFSAGTEQLTYLGVEELDMLMLDYPATGGCEDILGQWRAFEALLAANKTRSIAVSNFDSDQLACLADSLTVPAVNQLRLNVGSHNLDVIAANGDLGIVVQSYSPLDSGSLISNSLCISIGSAHNKSSAQVALKWILQSGATIATQSTSLTHLQADLDIFDFTLSDDEIAQLNADPGAVIS